MDRLAHDRAAFQAERKYFQSMADKRSAERDELRNTVSKERERGAHLDVTRKHFEAQSEELSIQRQHFQEESERHLSEFKADSKRLARERAEVKSRSEALSRLRAELNAERDELSRERAEFRAESKAERGELARERDELQMMSDQLVRECRQLRLRSACGAFTKPEVSNPKPQRVSCFAAPTPSQRAAGPPKQPPKPKVKAPSVRDSSPSSHSKISALRALRDSSPSSTPVTRVARPQATAPARKPQATAKRSGPPTELSKIDDRAGVLQCRLEQNQEKLNDLLQTSTCSDPKIKKLTRLLARIKKQLTTLNLKRYQLRQRRKG